MPPNAVVDLVLDELDRRRLRFVQHADEHTLLDGTLVLHITVNIDDLQFLSPRSPFKSGVTFHRPLPRQFAADVGIGLVWWIRNAGTGTDAPGPE